MVSYGWMRNFLERAPRWPVAVTPFSCRATGVCAVTKQCDRNFKVNTCG
jgi:hypothetical protein